jgi:polyhydroxyalkanoate synthesis regulator phasin
MKNELKRTIIAGLGAVFLTREKVEKTLRKMVDEAKITEEDARRLSEELMETGERQWDEMDRYVREIVRKGMDGLDIGSRKDFESLKTRVRKLEKRMTLLEEMTKTQEPEA